MAKIKDEPVAVGGAASIGIVSMLLGVSQVLGLELDETQIAGAVAAVIAVVTWLQRRKSAPAARVAEDLKMAVAAAKKK